MGFNLPSSYGDHKVVLMVRDPYWIFAYWETQQKDKEKILRIYEVPGGDFFDIEITNCTQNWYIKVPTAGISYCAEIGYNNYDGKFISIVRSNIVTTPLDRMSDIIDEQWMLLDWEQMYALSGGLEIRWGSEVLRKKMAKRLQENLSSGQAAY